MFLFPLQTVGSCLGTWPTAKPGKWVRTIWRRALLLPFQLHGRSSLWCDQGSGKQRWQGGENTGISATTCSVSVYANCAEMYRNCVCVYVRERGFFFIPLQRLHRSKVYAGYTRMNLWLIKGLVYRGLRLHNGCRTIPGEGFKGKMSTAALLCFLIVLWCRRRQHVAFLQQPNSQLWSFITAGVTLRVWHTFITV